MANQGTRKSLINDPNKITEHGIVENYKLKVMKSINKFEWFAKYGSLFIAMMILFSVIFAGEVHSQTDFRIKAGCDLCLNGTELLNYMLSDRELTGELQLDRCKLLNDIVVQVDVGLVSFGTKQRNLNQDLLRILSNVSTACKIIGGSEDAQTKTDADKGNILTPITGATRSIWDDFSIRFANVGARRYIVSPDYYVNPYFQAFGGDELGLPFAYGPGVGMTAAFGTPYSGPMETDFVKGGLHLLIFDFSVTSRIKEFVLKYSSNRVIEDTRNTWIGNWNNLYTPHLGFEVSGELPFLRLSYFSTIDTLDETDPPVIVRNEVTGEPMKNNIVRGEYFGFELRTPNIIVCNSSRAKFYFAKKFGEYHLGYSGREMKIDNFIFDFRLNATFPGKRDFQLLAEMYFDSQWAGFANKALGIGPSIRLGKTPSDNFGVITAFLNMRIKIGDFFDPELY